MLGAVDLVQPAAAPQLFESGPVTMARTDPPKVVVSAIGAYSCGDIVLSIPTGGGRSFDLRVLARIGDARILLSTVKASDLTYTTEGTRDGAMALSVRGRPCSALEVEVAPIGDDVTNIQVFLQAWHADTPHEATAGPERILGVKQGAASAASGRWPVYLSDGATAQGQITSPLAVRLSTGAASFGTSSSPVVVQPVATALATFSAGADRVQSLATPVNSTTVLGAIWNPNSSGKRVELQRMEINYSGTSTSGVVRLRARRITAAPSGAAITAHKHDPSDPNAVASVFVAVTNVAITTDFFMAVLKPAEGGSYIWSAEQAGKPIVLRQNEGFEVRVVTEGAALSAAMSFGINFQWIEI